MTPGRRRNSTEGEGSRTPYTGTAVLEMELELTPKPVPGRSLYKNHLGEGIGELQVQEKENVS